MKNITPEVMTTSGVSLFAYLYSYGQPAEALVFEEVPIEL